MAPSFLDRLRQQQEEAEARERARDANLQAQGRPRGKPSRDGDDGIGGIAWDAPIEFVPNAKPAESISGKRYHQYCVAKTLKEAKSLGASRADLRWDFGKNYLREVSPASNNEGLDANADKLLDKTIDVQTDARQQRRDDVENATPETKRESSIRAILGAMPKRAFEPELNSWVLVRLSKDERKGTKRPWKEGVPALVSQISEPEITVLIPNLLSLQHNWPGPAFSEKRVSAADIRPYEGPPRHVLTDALLRALRTANSITKFVEEPGTIRQPPPEANLSGGESNFELVFGGLAIPDFAGLLAEYLWSEAETGKTTLEVVTAMDCLPFKSIGVETSQHCVPVREPVMFRFMRTSRTLCQQAIAGIKARSRVCDSSVSLRYISIILGVSNAAFPEMWKARRRLCARPTTDDDREKMSGALSDMISVHQGRRASLRASLAEASLGAENADLKSMWDKIEAGRLEDLCGLRDAVAAFTSSVANVAVRAFSQRYKLDPYIVGLPRSDIERLAVREFGIGADALDVVLQALEKRHKLCMRGDLVFLL